MTAHTIGPSELAVQIADEWLDAHRKGDTWRIVDSLRDEVVRLADSLAAAEHRATRAEAQAAIRGRAVAVYRERAREAEAQRDVAEAFVSTVKELVNNDDRRIIGEILARRKAEEAAE